MYNKIAGLNSNFTFIKIQISTMLKFYSIASKTTIYILIGLSLLVVQSCATYSIQKGSNVKTTITEKNLVKNEIDHVFYLTGNTAIDSDNDYNKVLAPLSLELKKQGQNSTLLILGNTISTNKIPKDSTSIEFPAIFDKAKSNLQKQLSITENFKGNTIIIPGNTDWQNGVDNLRKQAQIVNNYLKEEETFLPQNGCPIASVAINDAITVITIDSQWYIENWDNHPTINELCTIKNRKDFFEELERLLYANEDKTILLAMSHPLFTNGIYGGQFGVSDMLLSTNKSVPIPLVGSAYNLLRKTAGINSQDILNYNYKNLSQRIKALIQNNDKIIVVSAHEQNLEYIEKDNIKQIISGAATETRPARAIYPNDFSYGKNGYAKVTILKNGGVFLSFFATEDGKSTEIFKQEIVKPIKPLKIDFHQEYAAYKKSSIYKLEDTKKTKFYNFLWGKHYRAYYGLPINAKVGTLENIQGGLTIEDELKTEESNTLLLKDNHNNEYVLRALKKNATRFFQSTVFVNQFVEDDLKNTYLESFLLDFYTTAHPFTPFIVDDLSKTIGLYHTNPKLYYIPKQKKLGKYNANFGDEMYMVDEIASDSQKDKSFFGKPDKITTTKNLYENIISDDVYKIDEKTYIKSRLFDMLLGDWNSYPDQWNWAAFEKAGDTLYKPIPKNRNQAFPSYGGKLMSLLLYFPEFRKMQSYRSKIANLRWLNSVGYEMDMALLRENKESNWIESAQFIKDNLTDAEIDKAFASLPKEVIDDTSLQLKEDLKIRRDNLLNYAKSYYKILQKRTVLVGTKNAETFIIKKLNKNEIEVTQIRKDENGKETGTTTRSFNAKNNKEIWIYGLESEDTFIVTGDYRSKIKVRIIGGQDKDAFQVENGNGVKIYDYKSQENEFEIDGKTAVRLSDDYEMNLYDKEKSRYNVRTIVPGGGYNSDEGLKLGFVYKYTRYGFRQNPYTNRHRIAPNYFFSTQGFEVVYNGHFPKLLGKYDFNIDAKVTSPNFAVNYFGYGNETKYLDKEGITDLDYNRVKMSSIEFFPSISRIGRQGSTSIFQIGVESIKVTKTADRFIALSNAINDNVFSQQQFASSKVSYGYENYDIISLPTLGMGFMMSAEWKTNIDQLQRNFFTLESKLNFTHKLTRKGDLVFETLLGGKVVTNDNFDFYHGASLGANSGMRGFRNERFLGRSSFYQTSDIRLTLGSFKRNLFPMKYGIIGGFDYGRVWLKNDPSQNWNTSYGGSLWLNGINTVTAKLGYFTSPIDKGRITVSAQFGF